MQLDKSDRTRATQKRYQEDRQAGRLVGLVNEPAIIEYDNWKLIVNAYPYDKRWDTSMLLVHRFGESWAELGDESIAELHQLKLRLKTVFDKIEENGDALASEKSVAHVHLLKGLKENNEQL